MLPFHRFALDVWQHQILAFNWKARRHCSSYPTTTNIHVTNFCCSCPYRAKHVQRNTKHMGSSFVKSSWEFDRLTLPTEADESKHRNKTLVGTIRKKLPSNSLHRMIQWCFKVTTSDQSKEKNREKCPLQLHVYQRLDILKETFKWLSNTTSQSLFHKGDIPPSVSVDTLLP